MKLRKRLVSLVLAFGMLASCLPTAFAEENPPQQNLTQSDQKAAAPTEGTCGEHVTWKLAGGTLTISGEGEMTDYTHSDYVPWKDSRDAITRVVVESGVTTVGDYVFCNCYNLAQVSLPDGLTCIGVAAFAGGHILTEIQIPSSVNEIKADAFSSCRSISSVDIPDGVTIINGSTFFDCSNLRSVTIPDSVVTISGDAFRDCTALSSISIPNSVVTIEEYAFVRCSSLKEIEIPDSVRNIYYSAFDGCFNLQKIRLSEQLAEISQGVFKGCSSLKEITVPDNVTAIKDDAFRNCTKLEKIIVGSSVNSIAGNNSSNSPFYGCKNLSEIYFTGDAPNFEEYSFYGVTATVYYPRNASGWDNAIQKQYGGTITWTPWTPGETTTRQFQINRDAWGFTNSTSAFGEASEGYYITQADYDRLTLLLSETEKKKISTAEKTKKFWEQGKYTTRRVSSFNIDGKSKEHIDWGGSCYGMSTWACLTKDGVRKISELGSTAENLHSVEFSPQVESAINFYQGQQDFRSSILARNQFMTLSQNEQLEQLESQLYDDKVSMICYQWYKKFDKNGEPKKNSSAAHAVVGYGVESGTWNKTVNENTDTYTKRILIYDCARGQYDEEYDLYYNDSGIWCVPGWNIRSASNEINGKEDNGILCLASNDKKILNAVDYAPNSTEPNIGYAPVVLATSSENNYSVNWGSGSANINGAISSNISGTDRINVMVETNVTADDTTGEVSAFAVLPEAKEYTIKSSEDGMPYELQNENYLTVAASKKSGTIKLQADGGAKIDTQEAGDYYISVTANDGYHELPWSTVEISGKDGKQISADMTDEGIVVSGDNLKDMTITGENDDQTQEVTVSTDKSDVLISSDNGDISVKQDSDGDGKYETDIVKPNPEPKPTTPVTEIFSDIYPSAWYIDYVQFVYDNGLMTGTSKTTFEPETTLSRAMVAQVLYNYDKRVDSPYRATNGKTFKDVSKNDWYYEAIQWASANGIASGVGNGYFEPNEPVTREQVAQFLYNYNGRPNVSGNLPFSDADKVSGWAKNAMLWAYQNKIINGTTSPDGGLLLDPQGGATRAQAAAILTNYMRNMM